MQGKCETLDPGVIKAGAGGGADKAECYNGATARGMTHLVPVS